MEKLKELLSDNWKAAVAGAAATLVALFTGMQTLPFEVAEMVVDEDVKAKICATAEEAPAEAAPAAAKKGADAGTDAGADAE